MGFYFPPLCHDSSLQSRMTFSFDVLTSVPPSGVMSELLSVMNRVAGEKAGKDGKRWQHPSDFTRRYATFLDFFFFCGFRINESEFYLSFCKKSSLVLVVWLCSVVSDYLSEVNQMLPDCFVRFVKD